MAHHYSRDELLKLRESPLVVKPPSLPPPEEWMGPPPDSSQSGNQQRGARNLNRAKTDDGSTTDALGNRRPAYEPRRKSTTAPEDIILGPSKPFFPSASGRNAQRMTSAAQGEDKSDRNRHNHRDRLSKDGLKEEHEDVQGPDTRLGQFHNRRIRDDPDHCANAWQSKTAGGTDKDRFSKRNGDCEEGRERDRRDKGHDTNRGGLHKNSTEKSHHDRRNGHWRSQDGPLWARDSSPQDEDIGNKPNSHSRDFNTRGSSGPHGQSRNWGRGGQQDEDPLWLDAAEPVGEKQGKTQADFEEFRAQMKAQQAKKSETSPQDPDSGSMQDMSSPQTNKSRSKGKLDKPLDFGDFSDKFYDILSQPKKQPKSDSFAEESRQEVMDAAVKMAKSSKFSSLFNTESSAKNALLSQPPGDASSEDRAGFQRILKLLDQQQQPNAGEKTPPGPTTRQDSQLSPPIRSPPQRQPEKLRSPPPSSVPNAKNSEFLLNLMRQSQQGPSDLPRQGIPIRREQENMPSANLFPNLAMSPPQDTSHHMPPSGPPPGFYEEAPRQDIPRQDKLNPNGPPLQRGAPPGLQDLLGGPQRPSGLPPGLERRPPGFDHLPPGYGQQTQQQRTMPPPPGFPPPQRGLGGGISPGMFGSRPNGPGMPPQPGFVNMGGHPPPGFAGLGGFGHDGLGFAGGGFEFGQGFPQSGQQRR